ncbi:MAG: glycosyltransferase family 4 protein [Proteobacteria bacterium]|nr:glycosyltransferase family 4 protein [Pseudomonadota bacterium]MDA1133147.1 glycosyltransferase family 4 protein [Pseudomonadota bacterium]
MGAEPEPSIIASAGEHRPPVILQVLPALHAGGVERGTVDISAAIAAHGWVSLVASGGGPMVRDIVRTGGVHITMPLDTRNPLSFRHNGNALVNLIRDRDVDLVHVRSRAPAWSAARAARITNIPLVTTFHGTYGAGGALKRRYNSSMLKGDRVIAISQFIAGHIRATYRDFDDSKLVVISRGVDLEAFDPNAVNGSRIIQLAKKWRLPDGVPVIMMPARFARWKGHAVLIEAMARMTNTDNLCLFVGRSAGHEAYRGQLERQARALGLASRVRFVDHESDMPAAYMLADVVVSAATEPEAFGRVAAEAQAMGRPVVATAHGGSREIVVAGETGWLVKPGDPFAMAAAIDEAVAIDEWKRQLLAARARRHVVQNFDLVTMGESTLRVYQELLARSVQRA